MYALYRNGRKASKNLFANYEAARQILRKRLRKLTGTRNAGQPALPGFLFGFEIRKVI